MAKITWSFGEGKAKESEIRKVEEELAIRFPDDYRQFMKTHKGGSPSPQEVKIRGRKSPAVLETLLNFIPGDSDYLLDARADIKDRLPPGLVPIASDPSGNFFAFRFSPNEPPTVVWWEHEEDKRARRPFLHVAGSFSELLESLRDYDDE